MVARIQQQRHVMAGLCVVLSLAWWTSVTLAATWNVVEKGISVNSPSSLRASLQALVNSAPDGTTFVFPAGRYLFCDLTVSNRSNLAFVGEYGATWEYCDPPTSYLYLVNIADSRAITLQNLTIDNRHIAQFGGIHVLSTAGLKILNNTFLDSNPRPPNASDRWGLIVARGRIPSTNIVIRENDFFDQSLEVDHAQGVVIEGNTITRSHSTTSIGGFSIGDNSILTDYRVRNNVILEPSGAWGGSGITLNLDPSTTNNGLFARILIEGNQIYRTASHGYNIRLGTGDTSKMTHGNVFRDITVRNNTVHYQGQAVEFPCFVVTRNASMVMENITAVNNRAVEE